MSSSHAMDEKPLPGAFILETAEYGLKASSILFDFPPSGKFKDLASKISLSATVLSSVGKEMNQNASCFKENFQEKFEHITLKCAEKYHIVLAAVEKACSFVKNEEVEGTESGPQKPWKRFLTALDMDKDKKKFEDFQDHLDESFMQALTLQRIVSLIVLQIRAQKYTPSPERHRIATKS